ncbi:sugar transporter [Kingella negevensis]|uniref:Sugar efflux transporter n=1 Tax=Kingella negevensis TaxID=1522312 RepID=A0A238HIF7_9NEIS|nr:sugar transporter [Kingella negevensis]MDK4685609.1 sugar transporter [Kingella negevensis]MDK4697995.1 sugar transporter [Kingella negevensis]MDK4707253.1 sugar transporter [Kingella negevensis]MDK4710269.1 sugar transporter [Kingella negevensis]SNB83215.1 Sugar efflux transporter [Kingella negevensis]
MLHKKDATKVAYLRVLALAVAAFIFNTTEFIPIALLTDIGKGFNMPVEDVGIMMTVYAWVVSLMSLPFMLLTANMERRKLLLLLFAVFIVGHGVSAIAWNFQILLVSRVMIALTHAVFWSITSVLVMRVAPRGKKQQALGWLSLGTALATILGLPLGRVIGQVLNWRTTLGLIGVLALGVMILLFKLLPKLESKNSGSLKSVPIVLKRPLLLGVYAMTAIGITAHFTAYSYIEPYVLHITHMSEQVATSVLLVFGLSGAVVSWLFGKFYPRNPDKFLQLTAGGLVVSLLAVWALGASEAAMFGLIFVWGIMISCMSLSMVARVLNYASDATDVASAIYSGIYNIGIGGGALVGGIVMRQQALGLSAIGLVGAVLAACGLGIYLWVYYRYNPQTQPENLVCVGRILVSDKRKR